MLYNCAANSPNTDKAGVAMSNLDFAESPVRNASITRSLPGF